MMSLTALFLLGVLISMNAFSETTPPLEPPRQGQNVFWSGHSLTRPVTTHLEQIANSLDRPTLWNGQHVGGSSIKIRARGRQADETAFPGYRLGYNRNTENLDVVAELRAPKTIEGQRYDALIITEVHILLYALLREDTVRFLRQYHELFIAGNPNGQTYLYESWLDVTDKSDPRSWIEYERAVSPVWQCVATRINTSLEAEGRKDRITSLPAGLSLAFLVERATSADGISGISGDTTLETMERLFDDNVHPSQITSYFLGLVTYGFLYSEAPEGAWAPEEVTPSQAAALQRIAWEFVSNYRTNATALELAECRALIRDSFSAHYWRYVFDGYRRHDDPWWRTVPVRTKHMMQRLRNTSIWRRGFAEEAPDNPLRFDSPTDRTYWHPLP